ncbi:MAG: hypothetical protein Q4C68_03610 [Moraxella sp.]|nr:hypothetical protein [Moraxella sp.]
MHNSTKSYPTSTVVSLYALFGGFIGGIQVGVLAIGSNLDTLKEFPEFLGTLFFFGIFGIFFGLIPAAIAGLIIAKLKLYKNIWRHYPIIALIGFVPSALCGVCLILMDGIHKAQKLTDVMIFFGALGMIGAVSALLLALFVLPKKK